MTCASSNPMRLWRAEQDFTLQEVADLTGYSESMLSRVERGERVPSTRAKVRIARRLGVPVGQLFPVEEEDDADL